MITSEMAESPEYKTLVSCIKQLETALFKCDRDITHFLLQEGFITAEVHDDVLNPRSMLTEHQKAGELVSGIKRKVALNSEAYHILVDHLGQSGKHYEDIVAILDKGYTRQQQGGGMVQAPDALGQVSKLSYALSRYRNHLKSYYRNFSVANDDKLFIAPCSEFINLALVKKEKSTHYDIFSTSTFHGSVDEMVAAKVPLQIDSLFESNSRFVLVEGPPGFGKSTLCWELCKKWDLGLLQLDVKIVLQLKLREKRIQNAKKLQELFYHDDERLSQSVVEEVLECEGEGVLLILDGLDEMPTAVLRNENSLIMRLITCKALPKAARLVTSRPSALHHKAKLVRNYRHVEILGFTDDSKMKYAQIASESTPDVFAHFKRFIFSNPIIKSLMCVPINCAIIAQVYQDISCRTAILPKTMTQLYTNLSLVLIRRHKIKTGEWDEDSEVPSKFEDLSNEILADLARVGEVAYRGLFAENLQLVFSASDAGRGFNHIGLMSVSREMYVASGAKVTYSFFHLSLQEFLAAWYASQHPELVEHAKINYFDKLNSPYSFFQLPPHMNAYARFLAGFVGLSNVLTNPVESTSKSVMTLLHCFYEAQNPIQDQKIFQAEHYVSIVYSLDAYVFGYALTHTTIIWNIKYCDTQTLDALHSILSQNRNPLSGGCLQCVSQLQLSVTSNISSERVAALISAMSKLSCVEVQFFQSDYMIFKALQALPTLREVAFFVNGCSLTNKGVDELITFLQSSNTLETVQLFHLVKFGDFGLTNNYHSIIESVLSCPTLTSFTTNIPFVTSKLPNNLTHVYFNIGDNEYTVTTLLRCMCCFPALCGDSSVKTLEISVGSLWNNFSIISEISHKLLPVLNKLFYSKLTTFVMHFKGSTNYIDRRGLPNNIPAISHSLSGQFEAQEHYIRRSQSCDLVTPFDYTRKKKPVSKSYSCPDLFDLQRLHILHPQLFKNIFTDTALGFVKGSHFPRSPTRFNHL